jgi:hypothetical protein
MSKEAPETRTAPVAWWMASLVSAVVGSAVTATIMVGIPRLTYRPPPADPAPLNAPARHGVVTVYTPWECVQSVGQCERAPLPLMALGISSDVFDDLAECQKELGRYVHAAADSQGRFQPKPGVWFACWARRRYLWYPPNR